MLHGFLNDVSNPSATEESQSLQMLWTLSLCVTTSLLQASLSATYSFHKENYGKNVQTDAHAEASSLIPFLVIQQRFQAIAGTAPAAKIIINNYIQ